MSFLPFPPHEVFLPSFLPALLASSLFSFLNSVSFRVLPWPNPLFRGHAPNERGPKKRPASHPDGHRLDLGVISEAVFPQFAADA